MLDFAHTLMGKKFFDGTLPSIARSLATIAQKMDTGHVERVQEDNDRLKTELETSQEEVARLRYRDERWQARTGWPNPG